MKVLQVTNLFAPVHGGAAEAPFQLCKQLAKRGHEVTLYTSDYKLSPGYTDAISNVDVNVFKTILHLANFDITPGIIGRARKEIGQFDVIHMHNFRSFQNISIQHFAQRHQVPYILQAHGSLPLLNGKTALKQIFDSIWGDKLLKNAAKVIAVTKMEAQQYLESGVQSDKIVSVSHGIDLEEFSTLPERGKFRQKFGLGDDTKIILYLGRINRIKGIDLLVKAFAGLTQRMEKARLVITGPDDGYLRHLRQLIKQLRIENEVYFTGPLYGRDKLTAYVDGDVYILPSRYEIFGITILEAWACGKPVIVSENCGIADIVADNGAGLVVSYDIKPMQDALFSLLYDEKRSRELGLRGKRLVHERFNWGDITTQIETIYSQVVV